MTSSITPELNDAALADVTDAPMFYVVSLRKFTVLFLATLSLYSVYWFYKNWDRYKDKWPYASEVGSTIWPVPRAVFSVFFVHALFREVKAYGRADPVVAAWKNNWHATALVLLMLLSTFFDRAANRGLGSPGTDIASIVIIVPLLIEFRKAQAMINRSCDDAAGTGNSSYTKANYAWIAGGVVLWSLIILGLLL